MAKIYLIYNHIEDTDCFCVKHERTADRMVYDLNKDYQLSFNTKKAPFSYEGLYIAKAKDISNIEASNSMWHAKHGYMFKKPPKEETK